nr:hypothetical protein [Sunxiuqinia sp.]
MIQLLRLILIVSAAYLLVFVAVKKQQADCAATVVEELAFADDQGDIQKPGLPPIYLLGKESVSFESVTKEERLHFQLLHVTQLVPCDFSFRKPIRLTFCLIDHEAPVPVFIRGHALLC